jgi:hypothetical protein
MAPGIVQQKPQAFGVGACGLFLVWGEMAPGSLCRVFAGELCRHASGDKKPPPRRPHPCRPCRQSHRHRGLLAHGKYHPRPPAGDRLGGQSHRPPRRRSPGRVSGHGRPLFAQPALHEAFRRGISRPSNCETICFAIALGPDHPPSPDGQRPRRPRRFRRTLLRNKLLRNCAGHGAERALRAPVGPGPREPAYYRSFWATAGTVSAKIGWSMAATGRCAKRAGRTGINSPSSAPTSLPKARQRARSISGKTAAPPTAGASGPNARPHPSSRGAVKKCRPTPSRPAHFHPLIFVVD